MQYETSISGFAQYLVTNSILSETMTCQLLSEAAQLNSSLIACLIAKESLDAKNLAVAISQYFNLPLISLDQCDVGKLPLHLLNEQLIVKYRILPLAQVNNQLRLALADPSDATILHEIKFQTQLDIQLVVVEYGKLNKLIDEWLQCKSYAAIGAVKKIGDEQDVVDVPIVKFLDDILAAAIEKKASDVHFEPYVNCYRIRFRIDGLLHEIIKADLSLVPRFSARLKILARLDIAERRLPQDGRFTLQLPSYGARDCRVSVCPTLCGEKIVVRILQASNMDLKVEELGMSCAQQQIFLQQIRRPEGLILVTGPTGSGKTITLYTALQLLNTETKNIITAEDPVEINLNGVNQVEVNNKIGLTFAAALRAFLRQDPDIIMVGEIRDLETAQIAIRAAQTGHLVFATLHTNSAKEAVMRLINMGIAAFNLTSSLDLVIAQRLVRKLCPHCKCLCLNTREILREEGMVVAEVEEPSIYVAEGCEKCHKGYKGRVGVFELLLPEKTLPGAENTEQNGMQSLRNMALQKVVDGVTSLEEVRRVVG